MAYQLYGLTEEERKVVEEGWKLNAGKKGRTLKI
jgi:hypothetical protein